MMSDRSSFVLHKVALIRTNFPYFSEGILRLKTFFKTSKILERNTIIEILSEINVKEIEKKRLDNKTVLSLLTDFLQLWFSASSVIQVDLISIITTACQWYTFINLRFCTLILGSKLSLSLKNG